MREAPPSFFSAKAFLAGVATVLPTSSADRATLVNDPFFLISCDFPARSRGRRFFPPFPAADLQKNGQSFLRSLSSGEPSRLENLLTRGRDRTPPPRLQGLEGTSRFLFFPPHPFRSRAAFRFLRRLAGGNDAVESRSALA